MRNWTRSQKIIISSQSINPTFTERRGDFIAEQTRPFGVFRWSRLNFPNTYKVLNPKDLRDGVKRNKTNATSCYLHFQGNKEPTCRTNRTLAKYIILKKKMHNAHILCLHLTVYYRWKLGRCTTNSIESHEPARLRKKFTIISTWHAVEKVNVGSGMLKLNTGTG